MLKKDRPVKDGGITHELLQGPSWLLRIIAPVLQLSRRMRHSFWYDRPLLAHTYWILNTNWSLQFLFTFVYYLHVAWRTIWVARHSSRPTGHGGNWWEEKISCIFMRSMAYFKMIGVTYFEALLVRDDESGSRQARTLAIMLIVVILFYFSQLYS